MFTLTKVSEVRDALISARKSGKTIGLVPTMGALHRGHETLIQTGRKGADVLVVTIFVNPLQFGPNEDYGKYPRELPNDLEMCKRGGADFVFAPSVEEMYPVPQLTLVEVTGVSDQLCGAFRPGHFRGVATVVLKLFNIVQPDRAWFGEKDLQQLAVIRRMVVDLNLPIEIIGVPTVRELDGLAISSRNQYLSPAERKAAPVLYRALRHAASLIQAGELDPSKIREAAMTILAREPLVRVEYIEVIDTFRIAAAIHLGSTRLIDNVKGN